MLTDIHCHLFDLYKKDLLIDQLEEASKNGISQHISVALTDEEIEWHLENKNYFFKFYAGIHPSYIDKLKVDRIVQLCENEEIIAIGEIGFDKRFSNFDYQKNILLQQLEIAKEFQLPVIFHNVKMYYELHKLIKDNFPKTIGILHSFNGSKEIFDAFKSFDFAFSINARFKNKEVMKRILKWGRFFIETDVPYQKPIDSEAEINSLKNLIIPYQNLINNSSKEFVARRLAVNLQEYFGL